MTRLTRMTRRTFMWSLAFVLAVTIGFTASPIAAWQATPAAGGGEAAIVWLMGQQADDGGFLGFAGTSDAGATVDAVFALAAARNAGFDVDLDEALAFLESSALVYAQTGPGQAAKLALAFVAAGRSPTDIATVNPMAIVEVSAKSGLIGFGVFDHAYGLMALAATGAEIPGTAIETLRTTRIADGSWAFDGATAAGGGDTNTTAMVVQALVAAGLGGDPMVAEAMAYLRAAKVEAGFPYQPGEGAAPDANSTALAIQAILATGGDPASDEWGDAAAALTGFQNESGAYRYTDETPEDNLFATVQAIPAAMGQALPVRAPAVTSDGTDIATPAAA